MVKMQEELGQYWRRLHRFGHGLLQLNGGGLGVRRLKALHGYAGHLARSAGTIGTALRTRCLSWWRFQQEAHKGERYGLHPRRFKAWRWEQQLVDGYGTVEQPNIFINDGWLEAAADRTSWKASRRNFCTRGVLDFYHEVASDI